MFNFPKITNNRLIKIVDYDQDKQDDDGINKIINQHLYCKTIQILTQNSEIQSMIKDFLINHSELEFLLIKNFPIHLLIEEEFINKFWNDFDQRIHCLSINNDVNVDNTMCIIDHKRILLSLNNDNYYRLGIIGNESIMNRKKLLQSKYRVEIDLCKPYFQPEKRYYQRIYECLKRSGLKFDVLLKYESSIERSKKLTLENYFIQLKHKNSNDKMISNMEIFKCIPKYEQFRQKIDKIFNVNKLFETNNKDDNDVIKDYLEWLCARIVQCDTIDDYEISTFSLREQLSSVTTNNNQMYTFQLDGFFTKDNIKKLMKLIRPKLFDNGSVNALIIHGFENCPQCWCGTNNEHYKNFSGENLYGISVLNNSKQLIWLQSDEYDYGIEKL